MCMSDQTLPTGRARVDKGLARETNDNLYVVNQLYGRDNGGLGLGLGLRARVHFHSMHGCTL